MPFDRTPVTTLPRPLGALEKLFWLADQHRPVHFAVVAEVDGTTRVDQWQEALDRVCRQSALIWSRIIPDEHGSPILTPVPHGSVPLHVVENAVSEWTAHVAAQLDQPFDASRAPLLRAVLLHGADRSVVMLCAHHSVADGLSLTFLMRDVLRAFAGEPVRLREETTSLDRLVATACTGLAIPQAQAAQAARPPLPYRPLDGARSRVEAERLPRETTQSLRERARAEGSTVHGALCAAVTAAGAALVPGWSDAPLRVLSPIDIRGRVLNGSDHFGLCVTAAILEDDGGAHDFWSRARSFSDRLKPAVGVETIAARVGLMQDLVSTISTVQQAQAFLAQAFSAEILLSNLGAADLQDTYGPLTLRALWGPAVLTGFATGQTVGAVTVGNRLHLLHSSCEPAQGLLGEVTSRLTAALRERRPARAPKPAFATGR